LLVTKIDVSFVTLAPAKGEALASPFTEAKSSNSAESMVLRTSR
jgi:hypothetical protein